MCWAPSVNNPDFPAQYSTVSLTSLAFQSQEYVGEAFIPDVAVYIL